MSSHLHDHVTNTSCQHAQKCLVASQDQAIGLLRHLLLPVLFRDQHVNERLVSVLGSNALGIVRKNAGAQQFQLPKRIKEA